MKNLCLILSVLLAFCAPAAAQQDDALRGLTEAAAELAAASDTLSASRGFESRISALSTAIRAYEHGLNAMRIALRGASQQERALTDSLTKERQTLVQLLAVAQSVSDAPAPLVMLHPNGPLASARAGSLISGMAQPMNERVSVLSAQLNQLRVVNVLRRDAEANLRNGLAELQQARTALNAALDQRDGEGQRVAVTVPPVGAEALDALLRASEDLGSFAAGLTALPVINAPASADFARLRGQLPPPVVGAVLRAFNQPDAAGVARPGLIFSAQPLALVSAPSAATVRYAGDFLNYGLVVILEPAPDYLITLTGLGRAFVTEGDVVAPGDPVGELGGNSPTAQEFLIETSSVTGALGSETLYMELRHIGVAIDPTDWFTPQ